MSPETTSPRAELEARLRFETLIAELSSKFVNLRVGEVDREIMEAERRICDLVGLDFAALWQLSDESPASFTLTHFYSAVASPQPQMRMHQDQYPWAREQLLAGRVIKVSSPDKLPPEAARDRETLRQFGIKSNLALPLLVGGEPPLGLLGLGTMQTERDWPDALVSRLQLIAQIFANALARKRSDQALRQSEARLAAGTDLAGLGYYEADYGARTCFLDDRFRDICGVPAEVKQGLDPVQFWSERIHPEDRQLVQEERQKLHKDSVDRISAEYRYLHPAKGQRWLHHSARVAERRAGGAGIRTFGVIQDITEHKQIAEQQAEGLRFVTLIADLSSRFVNLSPADVDGAIEDSQRRVCGILRLDLCALWQWRGESQELLSMTHIHGVLAAPLPAQFNADDFFPWCRKEVLAGRTIVVSNPDSLGPKASRDVESWRHFGAKSSLVFPLSAGGAPSIGALSFSSTQAQRDWPDALVERLRLVAQMFANALARKRTELALRESLEVNRATFDLAAVGIAHVGTDGRWLRVNDKLCAILGYPREELMRLSFQDITHPDDLETDLNHVRQILAGEIKTYSMEKRYLRKDRSLVWTNLTVSLVRTERGEPKHFISVVEDITERKRAEEEMQRLRLQLWHADRVAQTGAITASLAHELNQPLTGILSTSQAGLRFLTSGNTDPALIREILTNIVHDTKRAGAVINGLRAMLRRKGTEREPISLADAVQGVLDLVHSELIARQVECHLRPEPDLRVLADKAQIQQVLLNLVMNALEAMQSQPPERRRLDLTFGRNDTGEAMVAVRDSGPGIPQDQREKLFMAFWTTKPQGMGIGLSISYSIIESHGGRLWCANNPDGGATFHFTLPLAAVPESA
jgi:PAS domain S-box-containing protein